jgi:hypothetical protein
MMNESNVKGQDGTKENMIGVQFMLREIFSKWEKLLSEVLHQ